MKRKLTPLSRKLDGKIAINNLTLVDFSSNDYLGLSRREELLNFSYVVSKEWGVGSGGSRLMSGDSVLHHELEARLAKFKGKDSALIYGCGYLANVGVISALMSPDDVIFMDRLCHASIIDGVLLARCRFFRFEHNDMNHLEDLLRKHRANYKNSLIIVESVYSMDGDICPLDDLIDLKNRYSSQLLVDEAHSFGVFGNDGVGLIDRDIAKNVEIIIGTFGKALGSFGAFVCCSNDIKEYLINHSRTFIFSTSLPYNVIAANLAALEIIKSANDLRKTLMGASYEMRSALRRRLKIETSSQSQIIPIIVGSSDKAVWLSENLLRMGYHVKAIRPPTVPEGSSRLRLSMNVNHDFKTIHDFVSALNELL